MHRGPVVEVIEIGEVALPQVLVLPEPPPATAPLDDDSKPMRPAVVRA